jgi:hypothetical protein
MEVTIKNATRSYIPQNGIRHSRGRGNLKWYIQLTGWTGGRRGRNMSPVRYKMGFYLPEDCVLHSHVTAVETSNLTQLWLCFAHFVHLVSLCVNAGN